MAVFNPLKSKNQCLTVKMPKKTVRNQRHPWNWYKNEREKVYRQTRTMSNSELSEWIRRDNAERGGFGRNPDQPRKGLINALMSRFDFEWRQRWRETYGWEFDEVRDDGRFRARIEAGEFKPKEKHHDSEEKAGEKIAEGKDA